MHFARSILLLLSGATAGIVVVISCGNHWHLGAGTFVDAAVNVLKVPDATSVCDCPAAEPPLAGRLVVRDGIIGVEGNQSHSVTVLCPPGAIPITGNCKLDTPIFSPRRDVILREAGFARSFFGDLSGWRCTVHNNESTMVLYALSVMCLIPAP